MWSSGTLLEQARRGSVRHAGDQTKAATQSLPTPREAHSPATVAAAGSPSRPATALAPLTRAGIAQECAPHPTAGRPAEPLTRYLAEELLCTNQARGRPSRRKHRR